MHNISKPASSSSSLYEIDPEQIAQSNEITTLNGISQNDETFKYLDLSSNVKTIDTNQAKTSTSIASDLEQAVQIIQDTVDKGKSFDEIDSKIQDKMIDYFDTEFKHKFTQAEIGNFLKDSIKEFEISEDLKLSADQLYQEHKDNLKFKIKDEVLTLTLTLAGSIISIVCPPSAPIIAAIGLSLKFAVSLHLVHKTSVKLAPKIKKGLSKTKNFLKDKLNKASNHIKEKFKIKPKNQIPQDDIKKSQQDDTLKTIDECHTEDNLSALESEWDRVSDDFPKNLKN